MEDDFEVDYQPFADAEITKVTARWLRSRFNPGTYIPTLLWSTNISGCVEVPFDTLHDCYLDNF